MPCNHYLYLRYLLWTRLRVTVLKAFPTSRLLTVLNRERNEQSFAILSIYTSNPTYVPLAFLRHFVHSEQLMNYSGSHVRCK